MDIQMPGVDGNQTCAHWRQLEKSFDICPHYIMGVSAGHVSNSELFDATMAKPLEVSQVGEALAIVDQVFRKRALIL
jgi:CheY-like chemotaxis protein